MTRLPLAGVKVVEIAQNLAGPFAGGILPRLGADVVKLQRPEGGDDARGWGPPFLDDLSPVFHAANASKRSITLDLRDSAAVAWLIEYLEGVDVLVQNLRPGVLEELGLGPETLLSLHPRLVYCSLGTFGRSGPLRLRPGYEPMVQAFAGLMMVNGEEGGPPMRLGTSVLDSGTGMWAALGVLAGPVAEIQKIRRTAPRGEWGAPLAGGGGRSARTPRSLGGPSPPQTAGRGMIQRVPAPARELMALPVAFDGERPPLRRRAPRLG